MFTRKSSASVGSFTQWKPKLLTLFLVLSLVPVYLASRCIFAGLAQTKDSRVKTIKKIKFLNAHVSEPVEVTEVRSNGKLVHLDEEFSSEHWLNDFRIKFKNVSGKTITHVDFNLLFPETGIPDRPMSYSLTYGLHLSAQRPDAPEMKWLAPGETAEVSIGPEQYQRLKDFVASRKDLNGLTIANLTLVVVYFDDGMSWSAGDLFRPDPSRPGKYVVVQDNQ